MCVVSKLLSLVPVMEWKYCGVTYSIGETAHKVHLGLHCYINLSTSITSFSKIRGRVGIIQDINVVHSITRLVNIYTAGS